MGGNTCGLTSGTITDGDTEENHKKPVRIASLRVEI